MTNILKMAACLLTMLLFLNCKKMVEVEVPATNINQGNVYNDDATATSVLTGIYTRLSATAFTAQGFTTITKYAGLSADEFSVYRGVILNDVELAYFKNELFASQSLSPGSEFWTILYPFIYKCNSAIEGIISSSKLSDGTRRQLMGESKFLRALFYFYLVNFYGDIPVVTSTDYLENSNLKRAPIREVYDLIKKDLLEAKELLNPNYVDGKLQPYSGIVERVRPTKYAAMALLARVYLYTQEYDKAESESASVINSPLHRLTTLDSVFKKNSFEAIWQLQPVNVGRNTEDARLFVLNQAPVGFSTSKPVYVDSIFVKSIEVDDKRKANWIGVFALDGVNYMFPYKYKIATTGTTLTEYLMILRLAEQLLIRAESLANLGRLEDAKSALDMIRIRSGLKPCLAQTKQELIDAILQERRIEFFAELGHRWLDIKRTKTVDQVMATSTARKGGVWKSYQQWYPVPFSELERAPNILQNDGYK